ncbi:MAG: carbamate kinase [Candidatus Hydrothermia bacterium]|nr:carbamate kinase [Candidatus Hydrothermia bacterium]
MEKVIIALGGNALRRKGEPFTFEHQYNNASKVIRPVVSLAEDGYRICITHGNGPQVGVEFFRNIYSRDKFPPYPLDALNAETQGWIGYIISRAVRKQLYEDQVKRDVVALITQVVVDKHDPAFQNPTKPIGEFFTKEEAEDLMRRFKWVMKEDAGRGYRVVVPSPRPKRTVEAHIIEKLVDEGNIVVASGGGGIPVIEENGALKGVEAVIDKDRASALLGKEIGADLFMILTEVDFVYVNFGKKDQKALQKIKVDELKKFYEDGQFPEGSMGPKIEAAFDFLKNGGREVIITSIERAHDALYEGFGTHIVK